MSSEDFDAAAATWDEPWRVERAETVAAAICAQVPVSPAMSVLDYGCGTGLLGLALRSRVARLTLADPSPGMVDVVRAKIERLGAADVAALLLDPEPTELPDRYDLIVSLMTLHHVPDPYGAVAMLARHLEPGGYLALADLDSEDGSFHGPDADVHHGFERAALRRRLADCGLRDLRDSTPYVMRKEAEGGRRTYPLFLISGRR